MARHCFSSDLPAHRPAGPRQAPAVVEMPVVIEVEVSREETRLVITGGLDVTTTPALAESLSAVLPTRPRRLVLDMAGTSFMDCGSARLIASAGRFLPDGGRPVIRNPSPPVRRVLELTGFDAAFQIER